MMAFRVGWPGSSRLLRQSHVSILAWNAEAGGSVDVVEWKF